MIRQYGTQRRRGGANPLGVGVIAVGSIYYLQDREFFDSRFSGQAVCRDPWIVEGFLNGTIGAAVATATPGSGRASRSAAGPTPPSSDRSATAGTGPLPYICSSCTTTKS